MLPGRWLVSIILLGALGILSWYAVLVTRADAFFRNNDLASLQNAVRLAPSNAAYHAILAEHLEAAGANPDAELGIASHLSPHESRYWIRRGFRAEVEQRYDDSERYLLEGYRVDRGFAPRWALMNYYFRRQMYPKFWQYTREALEMSSGNLDPIFRLCLIVSDDSSVTRKALPPKREILFSFLQYLIQHEPTDSATSIASELAPGAQEEEVPELLVFCDRQMGHDIKSAMRVWNALCHRQLLPFAELSPERGEVVTNGDFSILPLQKGFDWKYTTAEGVTVGPGEMAPGLSITFNGRETDSSELMAQPIPLSAGKQYVLHYEYRLIGNQPDSGVQWVVRGAGPNDAAGKEPLATSAVFSATNWSNERLTFTAGDRDAARLILLYKRAPGTIRWKGSVEIRHVRAEIMP